MKILITGGSGLLGQYLNLTLSQKNNVLTLYNKNKGNTAEFSSAQTDITNFPAVEDVVNSFNPDIVIHTAAISRNEQFSSLPEEYIFKVNVAATKNIARLCDKNNSKLIYTSTDLVYDGNYGSMLNESSPVSPASPYAKTKLLAEKEIKDTFNNYIILRTSLLYGIGLNNSESHFSSMLENLKCGKEVKLFYDQFRTPLSVRDAADILSFVSQLDITGEIINFGGRERVSRFQLGEILCEIANLDKKLLIKTSMKEANYPPAADVSMDTSKLQNYGIKQKSINQSIKEILENS